MKRNELGALAAFALVAEHQSFTKAAAQLGMSQSALSRSIRQLEDRVGLRLLARTTRSVSTTDAGQRLLQALRPALNEVSSALLKLGELRTMPSGHVRIVMPRYVSNTVIMSALARVMPVYPDISIEITHDERFVDIVAERFDAGIRLAHEIEKDMIAVPITPPIQASIVASPAYFALNAPPLTPHDLLKHNCIKARRDMDGDLFPWPFQEGERPFSLRVNGPLTFNHGEAVLAAALSGLGIAYLYDYQVHDLIAQGRLIRVLADWCPTSAGFCIYYTSRVAKNPALEVIVNALRYRETS